MKQPHETGDGIDWLEDQCECHFAQQTENEFMAKHERIQEQPFKKTGNEFYASEIKDSKCERQDSLRVAKDQEHLSKEHRDQLYSVLSKYQELFEGTLGT